ncbi:FAD:protein FMN transferase [Streptomyces sp. MUM 178J]|uniref:FAD:protein FMN transferase n=1 Tax=Streptomyces sp. MUM 178J TaxID=2791991 RepID=UPI001F03A55F|nr:FAD:protein FMN transferase [Streptomyces sp. MUM 178J]WRQ80721.1 FAD:protein FMN transferase [Streptomyces sp. MUM 178J]
MGTVFSFDVRGCSHPSRTREALTEAVDFLHHVDRVFSPYREDSEVSRLARGELTPEQCGPDVREVTGLCKDVVRRTEGWFSPWYAGSTGGWDPTGLVKGWATERAARILTSAARVDSVCVNGGGDIQLLGGPWRIGLADPLNPGALTAVVEVGADVPEAAVATSGPAERGCHILDPHTAEPPAHALAAMTVVGSTLTVADAFATAAYAMGDAAHAWLEAQPDAEGLATTAAGATWQSTGFARWTA